MSRAQEPQVGIEPTTARGSHFAHASQLRSGSELSTCAARGQPASAPSESAKSRNEVATAGAPPAPLGTPEAVAQMRARTQALRDQVAALDGRAMGGR